MFEVTGLFSLLVLIFDVYAIVRIIRSDATPVNKTLWIVVVLLLPVLGVVLWLFFGPR
jgi:hypothetical protein